MIQVKLQFVNEFGMSVICRRCVAMYAHTSKIVRHTHGHAPRFLGESTQTALSNIIFFVNLTFFLNFDKCVEIRTSLDLLWISPPLIPFGSIWVTLKSPKLIDLRHTKYIHCIAHVYTAVVLGWRPG